MAHGQSDTQSNQSRWLIGGGFLTSANPYEDMDDEVNLIPFISYETGNFHIGFDEVS